MKKESQIPETVLSLSDIPLKAVYTAKDLVGWNAQKDLGGPGEFPFTRGLYPDGYRKKLWTIRQFAGFGSAKETNQRFHFLLASGQTGLSTAFDLPTLMGYDSDHSRSEGEVGKCGVAIDSLADMEELYAGIRLDQISTSMTINGPAAIMFAFYVACAEKQGCRIRDLRGTLQNDILKEYIAQRTWIYPPEPSLRIIVDLIKFTTKKMPDFNPVSVSGYHIREAGSTAIQELAFTLMDGFTYVEECQKAGLKVDDFAPRISFFFNAHLDFFEEIAKYRAARRIWARYMKDVYKAKNPRSWWLRFHAQTAGVSLTEQQPENNIIRTAIEALSAVLGGCQSLHTNSLDETIALPSKLAAHIAVRTQQVLAYETGVANVVDPLGGSYYLEWLTNKMEEEAEIYFKKIRDFGGVVAAIEAGFYQKEISDAAERYQREVENKKRTVVGVNQFKMDKEIFNPPILEITRETERMQIKKIKAIRKRRNNSSVRRSLSALKKAASGRANLIPFIIDCAKAYATMGEIADTLREEFGEYIPPSIV
ncbi:MAG: methylmalonyl-CoA mutase [Candidatus Omnitrophica bacterium]|nr:methylmalonyl-CoA mutase [Candidatus Omnitrophota bacterium]